MGCPNIIPTLHTQHSQKMGKKGVKWGVFFPSAYEDLWDEQSYGDYYSSNEGEEAISDSEEEAIVDEGENDPDIYITRSGRKSKPPERLQYDAQACLLNWDEHEDQESWSEQHLLAFKASTDPDTMYHHQAMKQPDREKFKEAMQKECEAHYKEGNYKLIKKDKLLREPHCYPVYGK
jgi:hypothetical protein